VETTGIIGLAHRGGLAHVGETGRTSLAQLIEERAGIELRSTPGDLT
jgi:hypothetical protein